MKENRQHPRYDVDIAAAVGTVDADFAEMMMSNLSVGGCFVRTNDPQPAGTSVQIRFKLPGSESTSLEAVGQVCWVSSEVQGIANGMGIQFDALTDSAEITLKRYIAGMLESDMSD